MSIKGRYEKALATLAKCKSSDPEERLILAIASMMEYKKPKAAKKEVTLAVGPQFVYNTFKAVCPDKLALDGYSSSDFGRLGKLMKTLSPPASPEEVEMVADWINDGGLSFWSNKPTFAHVAKHFGTWLICARDSYKAPAKKESPIR